MKQLQTQGFTVIELMIATVIFSTVLLLATSGLLAVGRAYYKGITSNKTQEVARSVIQEITQDFELSGGYYSKLATTATVDGFCIGNRLYSYKIDNKINNDGTGHALVVRDLQGCDTISAVKPDNVLTGKDYLGIDVTSQWRELLAPNMRVHALDIFPDVSPKAQAISLHLSILYGDKELFDNNLVSPTTGLCKGGFGSQFCANSELSTYAVRRLRIQ